MNEVVDNKIRTIASARAFVKRLAVKHDLDIEVMRETWMSSSVEIEIGAPEGYRFGCESLHWLVHYHDWLEDGYTSLLHQAWVDAANRLPQYLPLEECPADCDCGVNE